MIKSIVNMVTLCPNFTFFSANIKLYQNSLLKQKEISYKSENATMWGKVFAVHISDKGIVY